MSWRYPIAVALAALACGAVANAQDIAPSITRHTLQLEDGKRDYIATAGLMPIHGTDDAIIGDMFYVAYTLPPASGETRPIAFIWNGGSGANSTPLHYGAFGPKRIADGAMKPNPATLLDIADIVFIDQIETGFGRYAPGVDAKPHLNQRADARTFADFIETWLKDHGGTERPTFLIGESYGVRRAQLVTEDLLKLGISPEALVLISGYSLVGKQLEAATEGAFRLPGYAALALLRGDLKGSDWRSEEEIHEAAIAMAHRLSGKIEKADASARRDFAEGAKRFLGASSLQLVDPVSPLTLQETARLLADLSQRHATLVFTDIWNPIAYDMRNWKSDGREWISQIIVDDLRNSLGFDPPSRVYIGQEYDHETSQLSSALTQQSMKVQRADGTIAELSRKTLSQFPELYGALARLNALTGLPAPAARPDDGLAASIVNFDVHFPAALWLRDSPMPELMKAAPEMNLFIAGGMYDDLLPCAVGAEMARRDLMKSPDRVRSKCYAGGHMMYDEESQAVLLSDDVRAFMRAILQGDPARDAAVTP